MFIHLGCLHYSIFASICAKSKLLIGVWLYIHTLLGMFMESKYIGKSKLQKVSDYSLICTIPKAITLHLGLDKGDKIVFLKQGDDYVIRPE